MEKQGLPEIEDLYKQIMLTNKVVWGNKLRRPEIEKWLSNFTGEVQSKETEQHIALWLLANFVLYNDYEIHYLCKTLFNELIHKISSKISPKAKNLELEINNYLNRIVFYCAGKPSESGEFILYHFRAVNNIPIICFLTQPDIIPDGKDIIAFIDDNTLSGSQFEKFLTDHQKHFSTYSEKILLTFISTSDAKNRLTSLGIEVLSCVELDDRSKCFSKNSDIFHNYQSVLVQAKTIAEHYGKKIKPSIPLGFDNGQFTYGFYYNIPNNSLPIFWATTNGWFPIIKRLDKNYKKKFIYDFERFI